MTNWKYNLELDTIEGRDAGFCPTFHKHTQYGYVMTFGNTFEQLIDNAFVCVQDQNGVELPFIHLADLPIRLYNEVELEITEILANLCEEAL